jgi:hypothetical protein
MNEHGTDATYVGHPPWTAGCRCALCREAHSAASRRRRERRAASAAAGTVPVVHGSTNTYRNYGCHCAACTAAVTADQRRRRVRPSPPASQTASE